MPRLKRKLPSYRLHKVSGQAVVTLNGRDVYLGCYGSDESKVEYDRLIAEWLANQRQYVDPAPVGVDDEIERRDLQVNALFLAYWDFATGYYFKDGKPSGELQPIRQAMKPLTRLYGDRPVSQFGPRALETVRQAMIDQGLSRKLINARVNRIRRMFRWGVSKELVPATTLHALQALAPLKKGRCKAPEAPSIKPVSEAHVEPVLDHVSPQVATMIRLQMLTGMRPSEVVIIRGCDLDTTGKLWAYTPASHKTEHHDKHRVIFLGPKAQEVLQGGWLKPDLKAYLFSPAEAEEYRRKYQHAARRTPMSCGNRPGTNRRKHRRKQPAARYTTESYDRAIANACKRAFPSPDELGSRHVPASGQKRKSKRWETAAEWRKRLGEEKWAELQLWCREHRWSPNQLRHNAATYLRKPTRASSGMPMKKGTGSARSPSGRWPRGCSTPCRLMGSSPERPA